MKIFRSKFLGLAVMMLAMCTEALADVIPSGSSPSIDHVKGVEPFLPIDAEYFFATVASLRDSVVICGRS